MERHQLGKRVPIACGLALLAGCTASPRIHPLDANHPAHAAAPEGVVREPSALTTDALVTPPEPAGSPHHHHHAGAEHAR